MKFNILFSIFLSASLLFNIKAQSQSSHSKKQNSTTIVGEEIVYESDGKVLKGFIAYDASKKGLLPGIVVVPEWWGSGEYVRKRARMLAELGYIALAADIYGNGKMASNTKEAGELATPFYQDPTKANKVLEAAIKKLQTYPQTDKKRIGGIGYCFGGSLLLNAAKMGMDFKAIVSFHGGLSGVPATTRSTKSHILVCHGGADKFISEEEIKEFKANLDSMQVNYKFIVYLGATHAFTNPNATETGKKFNMPIEYNLAGDKKSWNDMKTFLKKELN